MLRGGGNAIRGIKSAMNNGPSFHGFRPSVKGASPPLFHLEDDELADMAAIEHSAGASKPSSWQSGNFPREGILWPNPLLESVRSSPVPDEHQADRLKTLWSLSNSHGVSWDELDQKFIEFHKEYINREAEWVADYDRLWDTEYQKSEEALKQILRKSIPDETQLSLALNRRRGKIRRMTYLRISRVRFNEILRPFHLKQFNALMRNFVAGKIAEREANERGT